MTFKTIADGIGYLASLMAAIAIVVKPIRDRLFGIKALAEGQKCTLRTQMLQIYKANKDDKQLTEDEYNNFKMCYDAYIALGGNSFITKLWREIDTEWSVVV